MRWCKQIPCVFVFVLFVAYAKPRCSDGMCLPSMTNAEDADYSSLLQMQHEQLKREGDEVNSHDAQGPSKTGGAGHVFMHTPYNFGNTIEKAAMFGNTSTSDEVGRWIQSFSKGTSWANSTPASWKEIHRKTQPGGQVWGHLNPDLHMTSNVTNCPLYLTPQKYWPSDVAAKYFGNKTVFGVLRDPFEKIVAQFRGAMPDYGGGFAAAVSVSDMSRRMTTFSQTCDLNNVVKKHLKTLKASGDMFKGGCVNVPQAEFYDGDYGIKEPIDNWRFPKSANEFFSKHGYSWRIEQEDVMHVFFCNDHWSAEFDKETRDLVRELYAKDFDLLCKHFGHCDFDQATCLQGVHGMCPGTLWKWDFEKGMYCPRYRASTDVRIREECKSTPQKRV